MDQSTREAIADLTKKINDLEKSHARELKTHKDAINKLALQVRKQQKILKTTKENLRTTKRELEGVRGSLRRL